MAQRSLDFWFDYSCPYAYLASTQVEALAARAGALLSWRPMLLGGVFAANGTAQKLFATLSAPKAAHNARDLSPLGRCLRRDAANAAGAPLPHGGGSARDGRMRRGPARGARALPCVLSSRGGLRATSRRCVRCSAPPATTSSACSRQSRSRTRRKAYAAAPTRPSPWVSSARRPSWSTGERSTGGKTGMQMLERELAGAASEPEPKANEGKMKHTLEIYWDFSSPFAYLGSVQAEKVAERHGATLVWRPMLLGGLFRTIGQADVPLFTWSDSKKKYTLEDMHRWAAYWGVPFRFPSHFPMNSLKAMRAYLALPEERRKDYRERTFRAFWAEDRDISQDDVLSECIGSGAADVLARTQDPAVKKELVDATDRAAKAGVFGAHHLGGRRQGALLGTRPHPPRGAGAGEVSGLQRPQRVPGAQAPDDRREHDNRRRAAPGVCHLDRRHPAGQRARVLGATLAARARGEPGRPVRVRQDRPIRHRPPRVRRGHQRARVPAERLARRVGRSRGGHRVRPAGTSRRTSSAGSSCSSSSRSGMATSSRWASPWARSKTSACAPPTS